MHVVKDGMDVVVKVMHATKISDKQKQEVQDITPLTPP